MTADSTKKPRGKGVPFKKKDPETNEIDPRINTKGRKIGSMAFRRMAREVAAELVKTRGKNDEPVTRAELLLRNWSDPRANPALQIQFVKYVAGSPDQRLKISGALGHVNLNATDMTPEQLKAKLLSLADFEITLEELREDEANTD